LGKLKEAEAFLESALASQDERLQPPTLFNLGHVRFGQGTEELRKGPSAKASAARGRAAAALAGQAVTDASRALEGADVRDMVSAYIRGRGARKEIRAATAMVKKALEAYGNALRRWERAAGDFHSAVELNPADADARRNAEVVDRNIAKLIDSIREMEQVANAMGDKKQELDQKMRQLKGRIPEQDMPPGAAGDEEEEEEDQKQGQQEGQQESPGKEGEEQPISLSPEQAGWLLESYRLDSERRLPMGENEAAKPKDRKLREW
jgi:tetratricopeptide (TPR) repeat protein